MSSRRSHGALLLVVVLACRDHVARPPVEDEPVSCDSSDTPFAEGELFGTDDLLFDAADWEGDGDIDVFVQHPHVSQLSMYENTGGENWVYGDLLTGYANITLFPIGMLDVDDDGAADFLSLVPSSHSQYLTTLRWHMHVGDGSLAAPVDLQSDIDCFQPYVLFDMDGDADEDLLCTSLYGLTEWLENLGPGTFGAPRTLSMSGVPRPVDLDDDGDADFLEVGYWFENMDAGRSVVELRALRRDGEPYVFASAPGDLDGDGDTDIVALVMQSYDAVEEPVTVGWWANQGDGHFASLRGLALAGPVDPYARWFNLLETTDLDGDGDDDVLYGDTSYRFIAFEAIGNGVLVERQSVLADTEGQTQFLLADLDGDDHPDVLSGHTEPSAYYYTDPYGDGDCDGECGLYRYRNQMSGGPDADADGTCDQQDACPGFHDGSDTDLDGIPNGCDQCKSPVDTDGDGRSDDCDVCPGTPDDVDGDLDGVPDICDRCPTDPIDDSDGDGVCESVDACLGFDLAGDDDNDGVCNNVDACDGDNATGDLDLDHVCDERDVCPGFSDLVDDDADGIPDGCDPVVSIVY